MSGFTLGRDGFGSFAVVSDFKSSMSAGIQGVGNSDIQITKTCDDLDCGPVYDTTFSDTRRQSLSFLTVDFRVVSDNAAQVAAQMRQASFLTAFSQRMSARGFDVSAVYTREPVAMNRGSGSSEAPTVDPLVILAIGVPLAVVLMVSAVVVYYRNMQKDMYTDRFETPFAFTSKGKWLTIYAGFSVDSLGTGAEIACMPRSCAPYHWIRDIFGSVVQVLTIDHLPTGARSRNRRREYRDDRLNSDIGFPPQRFVEEYSWDPMGMASGYPIERAEQVFARFFSLLCFSSPVLPMCILAQRKRWCWCWCCWCWLNGEVLSICSRLCSRLNDSGGSPSEQEQMEIWNQRAAMFGYAIAARERETREHTRVCAVMHISSAGRGESVSKRNIEHIDLDSRHRTT